MNTVERRIKNKIFYFLLGFLIFFSLAPYKSNAKLRESEIEAFECVDRCAEIENAEDVEYIYCYEKACGCEVKIGWLDCRGKSYEEWREHKEKDKKNVDRDI